MFSPLTNKVICSKHMTDQNLQMNRCLDVFTTDYSDHPNIQTSKHPNIWSFVIFKESYDLSGRSHFGETSKHLFICRFWRVRWAKHLTSSVVKTSKHLFIWPPWSLLKHLNICSSGGFEESDALSKTSYFLCGENI